MLVFLFLAHDIVCQQKEGGFEASNKRVESPGDGIRIAWDYKTLKQLSPVEANYAGYARMIKLQKGDLFCVYESGGSVYAIRSRDGLDWSEPTRLASRKDDIARAVPEVLQLQDQSILVSYNLRPRQGNTDPAKRFSIEVIRSTDDGHHWSEPIQIYKAGFEFKNGCWEPAQIQLPSGEIQLFIANEGPYTQSNEQEITLFRSFDAGATWSKGEAVSFRKDHRDGMPVPLLLKNKPEIIFAMEDNGIDGKEFKPATIRTTVAQNWSHAPVGGSDKARVYAMDESNRIATDKYAGAPYIRQLTSGEVILSYQSNEYRKDFQWDRSDMVVAIGSSDARNFKHKSLPFYTTDSSTTALWNSLCVENDSTVIALSSTNAYGKTAVWMIKGYIMREIKSTRGAVRIDAEKNESLWKTSPGMFIGGFGATQAHLGTAWSNEMLYIGAEITDLKVFHATGDPLIDDAIQFFLDTSPNESDEQIFSVTVTAGGKGFYKRRDKEGWSDWKSPGVHMKAKRTPAGYQVEVGIPWAAIRHRPGVNGKLKFHSVLAESTDGTGHRYREPIAGNATDSPDTWCRLFLTK